jgi:hypothetical protein
MSDTLGVNQSLSSDERITSANGRFHFGVLSDGNVAVGDENGAVWDLGVHDAPGARLDMQADGNLVLYKTDGGVAWASNTSGQNAYVKMQDDRNVVLYNGDGAVLWSPNSYEGA